MLATTGRISLIFLVFLFLLPLQATAGKKITVYTVNYPLYYFAQQIGGDHVKVVFPAPADLDPAFWKPDMATVREYQKADLIILNGAGYAKWIKKVSLPMSRMVDTSKHFNDNLIHSESTLTHSHGPKGDHSHSGTAFTTWLDFSQAALQARAVYESLVKKDQVHKDFYEKNHKALEKKLLKLDRRMKQVCSADNALPLLASHPIYQYLARRYELNLHMVMWEPDTDPGKQEWANLEKLLGTYPAKRMVWEGEPLESSVKKLADLGIQGQVFSPCFSQPEEGDFLLVMERNIDNLAALLTR